MKTIKDVQKDFRELESADGTKMCIAMYSANVEIVNNFIRSEIEQILEELPTETLKVSDCELGYVFEDGSKKTNDKLKEHIEKLKQ